MGVVNVTPDSFSDGGSFLAPDAAIAHGRALAAAGAAVLDVGGESTRPGAEPVDADEELRRVVPVVRALVGRRPAYRSASTRRRPRSRRAALEAGATIVNDVSGGTADASMLSVVAEHGAGFVAMHMQGTPRTMQHDPSYDRRRTRGRRVSPWSRRRRDRRRRRPTRDPRRPRHRVRQDRSRTTSRCCARCPRVAAHRRRAARRRRVPQVVPRHAARAACPVDERDEATLAVTVWSFHEGAAMVRVHDVAGSVRAAALLDVLERATADRRMSRPAGAGWIARATGAA